MKLFLDCEFNGFGGELISMALVDENECYFYEVLPCDAPIAWVAEHVIPILNQPALSMQQFQSQLRNFLFHYDSVHIIADWPEDLSLFLNSLILGFGTSMTTPPMTLELYNKQHELNVPSAQPHNALQDALALKRTLFI